MERSTERFTIICGLIVLLWMITIFLVSKDIIEVDISMPGHTVIRQGLSEACQTMTREQFAEYIKARGLKVE